jgi:predicted transcriptional regulator
MKRTTVFLDERLESDLHTIARRQKRPLASVVREALDGYVSREVRRKGPGLRFAAIGASGRPETADRHEELLFQTLHPHGDKKPPSRARTPRQR